MKNLSPDYPIEYNEGKVHFFGRDFLVTPDVLIPRLETESLVRRARHILRQATYPTTLIDIGCGSGIIGTSLADLADTIIFLDISLEALSITQQNFQNNFPEKKAHYIVSDLLEKLPNISDTTILFVTNLPYIKNNDWIHMSADTLYEPKIALFGGEKTGFELYERLFEQIIQRGNTRYSCLFEFGFDQREIAEKVLKKYPHWEYSFFADYAGVERFGEFSISSV